VLMGEKAALRRMRGEGLAAEVMIAVLVMAVWCGAGAVNGVPVSEDESSSGDGVPVPVVVHMVPVDAGVARVMNLANNIMESMLRDSMRFEHEVFRRFSASRHTSHSPSSSSSSTAEQPELQLQREQVDARVQEDRRLDSVLDRMLGFASGAVPLFTSSLHEDGLANGREFDPFSTGTFRFSFDPETRVLTAEMELDGAFDAGSEGAGQDNIASRRVSASVERGVLSVSVAVSRNDGSLLQIEQTSALPCAVDPSSIDSGISEDGSRLLVSIHALDSCNAAPSLPVKSARRPGTTTRASLDSKARLSPASSFTTAEEQESGSSGSKKRALLVLCFAASVFVALALGVVKTVSTRQRKQNHTGHEKRASDPKKRS